MPDPKEIEAGVKALEGAWKKSKADLYCLVKLRLTCRLATCHAPKYCLCLLRHAWMTRLLQSGVDPITVATLAGHIDTSMLAKQYQHLAHDPEYLLAKARRAF